jgi:hypothetical protein
MSVTVACSAPVSAALVAAAVLLGCDVPFSEALALVRDAMPGSLTTRDDEVALSVGREHLREFRDRQRRRVEALHGLEEGGVR